MVCAGDQYQFHAARIHPLISDFSLASNRLNSVQAVLEPVTHFLFGAAMGRAGLNRKTALATATLTLAAEAPDLDLLGRFGGSAFGFNHHRGFTHSFLGVPLVAAAVVAFIYFLWRLRGRKTRNPDQAPRWGLLFAFACLAGLSHILLDFTNNYGVRPWWPFSERWYSWDIVFIFEPVIFGILLLGLILPGLFSLVNEEIGARNQGPRAKPAGRLAATLAILGVFLCWGVRDYEHRRAIAALEARNYQGADALRVSAYPRMTNPFRWYGVAETQDFFATMNVDSLIPEVDPTAQMQIHYKPEETPITLAAKKTYLGRVYLSWAQYPITETEELQNDPVENGRAAYLVRFRDLRYSDSGSSARASLGATVSLTRDLQVVDEGFGMRRVGTNAK
jgi:inner membrane protein